MKTKAAVLYEINKPLVIEEIEVPKLKRGQVLVRISATGICRTQLNEIMGLKGPDRYLPHLLGHEAAGIVEKTGQGITKVKKGDYVVCSWITGNGLEGGGSVYLYHRNKINSGPISTFSEYAVISENRLTKIPRKVAPEVASILGCAVATGLGIIKNTLQVKQNKNVAIFGVGGIGSSAIIGAKYMKSAKIIVIDITYEKLKFAKSLGATHVINALDNNAEAKIREIEKGGVDYAIEASGVRSVMETAYNVLNSKGKLAIAGNLKKGEKISIDPFGLIEGKEITGTWGGETKPDKDIVYYARKYLKGDLKLDGLITKKYKLEEINEAFLALRNNKSLGRTVIEFNG